MKVTWILVLAACSPSARDVLDAPPVPPDASADAWVAPRCDAPPTFADGLTPSRRLYVDPTATPGGDTFASIADAARAATPGTAIVLRPGVHVADQQLVALDGTEHAPIWIGGEVGKALPVIEGGLDGLHLTRAHDVVIHDLEVRGQSGAGIVVDDGGDGSPLATERVAVVGVRAHDIGGACITAAGLNDGFVYDSQLARCGGIELVGAHRIVIARDALDGAGVTVRAGASDVDVRQSRLRGAGVQLGASSAPADYRPAHATYEARRVRAFDDIVTGTPAVAFALHGCDDCLIAHDLVKGAPPTVLRIEPAAGLAPVAARVVNNSFVFTTASRAADIAPEVDLTLLAFGHDLWLASDDPTRSDPQLPVADPGAIIGGWTGYREVPDDPAAPLAEDALCFGEPEDNSLAPALSEVPGTLLGTCRGTSPTAIGPFFAADCTL